MSNMIQRTTEGLVLHVAERFGSILKKTRVNKEIVYMPIDLAFRTRAEREVDGSNPDSSKYTLEFINIWLEDLIYSKARRRTPLARAGVPTEYDSASAKTAVKMFKAVPVDMTFSITMWTKFKDKMDDFIQEFVFWQQENPNVDLYYEENKKLELDILIDPRILAEYDTISKMYREGKYWKHTFNVLVESWLLKGVAVRTAKTIVLTAYQGELPAAAEKKLFETTIS